MNVFVSKAIFYSPIFYSYRARKIRTWPILTTHEWVVMNQYTGTDFSERLPDNLCTTLLGTWL